MPQFIYVLRPVRPSFVEDMTPDEEAVVNQHFDYLQELTKNGRVLLAGRCLDGTFGIVILEAAEEKSAANIVANDPAVKARLMNADLYPFRVAIWGKGL